MVETKKGTRSLNLFCGYKLNNKEQEYLLRATMAEFEKPKHARRTPLELINETKNVLKYYHKWLTK